MSNNAFSTPHGGSLNLTSKVRFMFLLLPSVITRFLLGHLTSSSVKSDKNTLTTLLLRTGGRIEYDTADKCTLSTPRLLYRIYCCMLVISSLPVSTKMIYGFHQLSNRCKRPGYFYLGREKICFFIRTNNIINI